ncbi:hypothetical protein NP493_14g05019 [Ridgeia piscesae]|uniref:Uncharacterized protein n=1 Tax=Ridgeia piscesae TaxID=27915 RepID=A0AAD9PE90_RIDPI|nr:hypothetical protein NP493_14g05019 [Ridgeia piscesae]
MVEKVSLQTVFLPSFQLWCPHVLPHNLYTMFAVQHQVKYVCNVSRSTSYKLVNKRVHTDKLYKRQLCTEQEAQTATSSSHTEIFCQWSVQYIMATNLPSGH